MPRLIVRAGRAAKARFRYTRAICAAGDASATWGEPGAVREVVPTGSEIEAEEKHFTQYIRLYEALLRANQ